MELRKIALITFIASVVILVRAIWSEASRLTDLVVTRSQLWIVPSMILAIFFSAVMPAFYFALYCDRATMRFPKSLRKLALAVAVVCCIVDVWNRFTSHLPLGWVSMPGILADSAYVLLLLCISRNAPEEPVEQVPVPELLRFVTKLAVLVWSAWLAFQLTRLPYTAFTYSFMQRIAFQAGRSAPPLRDMLTEILLKIFYQAALLAAPYIVWRSDFGRRGVN